jgi:hypothetical protein
LYQFAEGIKIATRGFAEGFELSLSENRLALELASRDEGQAVKLFDMTSKTCLATLNLTVAKTTLGLRGRVKKWRFLGEDKILFCGDDWICLCRQTSDPTLQQEATLLYQISANTLTGVTWVKDIMCINHNEFIYCTLQRDWEYSSSYEFALMDVRTGSRKSLLKFPHEGFQLVGSTTKWLLTWNHVCGRLYVYNLATMEMADIWEGKPGTSFAFQKATRTGSKNIICFLNGAEHDMKVMHLDENSGKLSLSQMFKVHSPHYNSGVTSVKAVAEPHVLVETSFGAGSCTLALFDLSPKKYHESWNEAIASQERVLSGSTGGFYRAAVSANRGEWYVSHGDGILVFLHSEPSIF